MLRILYAVILTNQLVCNLL